MNKVQKTAIFPRPNPHNLPLSKLSDFKLIGILGKGQYGTVGKFVHIESNIEYAIKTIITKDAHPKQILMIQREIELLYKIKSQYIVQLYDHFEDKQNVYLITEVLAGKDLFKSIFKEKILLPFEEIAKIIYQLCLALEQMHRNYIIHRDIKLENVVWNNGNIKVVDLGCSNYYGQYHSRYTKMGTLPYYSPQLLNGEKQDDRLDVWCLGVMLYELIALESPFTDPDMTGKIKALQYKIPKNLKDQPQLLNLIKSILTYKRDRLRAHQVRNHPFIKKYYSAKSETSAQFENYFDQLTIQQYRTELIGKIEAYKKDIQILRTQNQQVQRFVQENKKQIRNFKN